MVQRLIKFFVGTSSISGATAILAVTLLVSNMLGVIRDHYLAQKIPATILDTYFAAFRLPDLIFNTLVLGAVSAAFIPVFAELVAKGKRAEANHIGSTLITTALIGTMVLAAIFFVAMPGLMGYLVPDFPPDKLALTVTNARNLLASPVLFGVSFIISGMLTATNRFVATALAPIFYNGSIILGTLLAADHYSVSGVVWAVIIGSFLHLIVQLPSLATIGFRFRPLIDWRNEQVRKIVKLMIPRTIGLGANQLMLLAFTFMAAKIGGGSIAIYTFADNIQTTPVVIFATSIAQALFPTLARHHALSRGSEFRRHIERAISTIIFFLTPMAVGMVLLRAQIVRLVLGSGYFGWEETIIAARTLGWFAPGLVAGGLLPLLYRAFFARHNTIIPTIGGIVAVAISIITASALVSSNGVVALPIGFSVGMIIEAVMLYYLLRRSVELNDRKLALDGARVLVASAIMAAAVQGGKMLVGTLLPLTHSIEVLAQLALATALGVIVYFPATKLLGHPGLQVNLTQSFLAKLNGTRNGNL
ncbi:MAG: murein biosynthesis integral membrane protein MurJ [Patescibacteria group bacterium]